MISNPKIFVMEGDKYVRVLTADAPFNSFEKAVEAANYKISTGIEKADKNGNNGRVLGPVQFIQVGNGLWQYAMTVEKIMGPIVKLG